jgi:acyl-CoA synthetase (AMP-forming)/AMP-acid ligase II
MVSHRALDANLAMIARAFGLDAGTRGVSWLPLYHDMGLIAGVAAPVFAGVPSVLMPPLAFLQSPLRWLAAIARSRASVSGAPTFAYELCARALEKGAPREMDLSSWKIAFCGGETVRAEALERFARAAAPLGFDARALMPCYGLAEATLLVSAAAPGAGVGRLSGADGRERVDCGRPCAGQRVMVAKGGVAKGGVAEGEVGELLVEGPNLATGYWNRPEESERLFCRIGDARLLRTGDLGFVRDGRVVLTGRLKDLLVIRGANHHPEDIERTVRAAHPALGAGAGAAFSVDAGHGEELVVVHELAAGSAPEAAGRAAAARIVEEHGLAAREIVLIRALTLPRTANGKVQRGRSREAYLAGTLAVLTRVAR